MPLRPGGARKNPAQILDAAQAAATGLETDPTKIVGAGTQAVGNSTKAAPSNHVHPGATATSGGAGNAGKNLVLDGNGKAAGRVLETDGAKLDGIEASAEVTSTAKVSAAGALMRTGGQMTGNITMAGAETVDGRDVSADGTALDALLARIKIGAGSPEGAVTASVGAIYLRTDGGAGTALYVKESGAGNTGWVAYAAPGP